MILFIVFGLAELIKHSSRSEDPDEIDFEDNSDENGFKIIKFSEMDRSPHRPTMVNRDSSPLSPMKKRNLRESRDTDSSRRPSGFSGFVIKDTLDIDTNNYGAKVTQSSNGPNKKKDVIPANPILPKVVYNEMK